MAESLFYVGSINRTLPYFPTANGAGISAFRLDAQSGAVTALGTTTGIDNPTFLAVAPDGTSLSATSEVYGWHEGVITAYGIDRATGALHYLDKQPTRGDITAHLAYDARGEYVAIANYGFLAASEEPNQSVVVYQRDAGGAVRSPLAEIRHFGRSVHAERQERPHAHCVRWTPDNRFIVVADLGLDRLKVYRLDAANRRLEPHGEAELPPGSGPRHFTFHPSLPAAYVANELSSTVATLGFDSALGRFTLLSVCPALPVAGPNHCSAIKCAPDGRFVLVGNRGHDSIGCFEVDPATGIAKLKATTPSGGKTPRDFAFDPGGSVLVVTNQDSDCLVLFRYDSATGALTSLGAPIPLGTPTAVSFVPCPQPWTT